MSTRRDLAKLAETEYDVVVIGGGMIGTGVSRDAAMRGLKTVLFEKEDFCYGTSGRSSRMIHGGLRYLANYDLGLVREGLREREILLRLAPHLVHPLKFLIPVYGGFLHKMKLKIGMILYDLLSYDKSLPSHKYLDNAKVLEAEPALAESGLKGGYVYYDSQIALTERLCMENVVSAQNHGALLVNHARVVGLVKRNGVVSGVKVEDVLSGKSVNFGSRLVVNVGGPWLDDVVREVRGKRQPLARTTKGIHLVTPKVTNDAVALFASDGRAYFVMPWIGFSLVGTTDTDYEEDMDAVKAEVDDVQYLRTEVEKAFPRTSWNRIFYTMAGVRSLLRVEGVKESSVTRRHVIYDHEKKEGLRGLISVIGGKLTAYRGISEDIVDVACHKLSSRTNCTTANENLPGADSGELERVRTHTRSVASEYGISAEVLNHLVSLYGSRYREVIDYAKKDRRLRERICKTNLDIMAEVVHSIEKESALTLTDFMLRRSLIGFRQCEGLDCCAKVAKKMGKTLRWSTREISAQLKAYRMEIAMRHACEKELHRHSVKRLKKRRTARKS
ncbi:FAD-dependent oxidoreductase [[Eubacterium] cellulosolvens]